MPALTPQPLATAARDFRLYRPDIDGLKAVAVLGVILFHYFPSLLPGGFIGVDIFFVISGYLIARSVLIEIGKDDFRFARYFARRAKRIFPSLIFLLLVLWVVASFIFLPGEMKSLGKHMAAASLFISNFLLWKEVGYFDIDSELKPLLNLWSLGVEEQFYLIFPPLFFLCRKLFRRVDFALFGLAAFLLLLSEYRLADHTTWAYYHPSSRLWELLAGSLLAYFQILGAGARHAVPEATSRLQHALSLTGIGLLAFAFAAYSKQTAFPGLAATAPVGGALCLIAAGPAALLNRRLLTWRPLIYIGLISYPLYLWHWPLIAIARVADAMDPPLAIKLTLLVATFLLSLFSYHCIERPIRFGRFVQNRNIAIALWISLLLVGATGFTTFRSNASFSLGHWLAGNTASAPNPADDSPLLPVVVGKVDYPPLTGRKAVLIGDSHAHGQRAMLTDHFRRRGIELIDFIQHGCTPFWNLDRQDPGYLPQGCPKDINRGIEFARHDASVDIVVLSARYVRLGNLFDITRPETNAVSQRRRHSNSELHAVFASALEQTLEKFKGTGKQLVLLETVPSLNFSLQQCLDRPVRFASSKREHCRVEKAAVLEEQKSYREIFAAMARQYPFVKVIDPLPAYCDQTYCYASMRGRLIYYDDNHITLEALPLMRPLLDF